MKNSLSSFVAELPVERCVRLKVEGVHHGDDFGHHPVSSAGFNHPQPQDVEPLLICPVRKYFDDVATGAFLLVHAASGFIRCYSGTTATATHQIRQLHKTVLKIKHCIQEDCIVTIEREGDVVYVCAYHDWRRNPDVDDDTFIEGGTDPVQGGGNFENDDDCLLYTSDAADE